MREVSIKTKVLQEIVRENRLKHDAVYNEAVNGYWSKAEEILTEKLNQVKAKERIEPYLGLAFPLNYSQEYEKVIRMLELSTDDTVKLSSSEFDCYVRNEWSWKTNFLATNGAYYSGCSLSQF